MENLFTAVRDCVQNPGCTLTQVANDIPLFHLLPFTELTYFKLYAHTYESCKFVKGCSFELPYEEFVESVKPLELPGLFSQIYKEYGKIDSVEVWDSSILNNLLKQLKYMAKMKRFSDDRSLTVLLDQFAEMLSSYLAMVERTKKEGGGNFEFFLCGSLNRMAYISVDYAGKKELHIKFNTLNSIVSSSSVMLEEAERWFNVTKDISLALGKGAELKRVRYFDKLFAKLQVVRDKLLQKS